MGYFRIGKSLNNIISKNGIVLLVLLLVSVSDSWAQQDSQFTQYMYNTQTVNPAYAGSHGYLSMVALYRAQWVGLNGAPTTMNFSLNTALGRDQKLGLGLSAIQDDIGPSNESNLVSDISYAIPLNNHLKLAFGLKAGVNLWSVDYSRLDIYNTNDPSQQNIHNRLTPVIGAGLFLHDSESWYLGFSMPNFLNSSYYDDVSVSNATRRATSYIMAGYVFPLNRTLKFKPAFMGRYTSGAPVGLDFSANFLFNESLTLGVAYGFESAVSALAGFQISDGIMIGYAYDYGLQDFANYSSGSHEVFLRFDVLANKRIWNPRFY